MQVILLEHIKKLGKLGDLVNVKSGFARNFLIPFGKAESATKINLARFEERRQELEEKANALLTEATQKAEEINGKELVVSAMASEEGKLYGSITAKEISKAIADTMKINIAKGEIILADGPIHSIGETELNIQFKGNVSAKIMLKVERQLETQ